MISENQFMGKPFSYWLELDRWCEENQYDELIEEIARLRYEAGYYKSVVESVNRVLKVRGLDELPKTR